MAFIPSNLALPISAHHLSITRSRPVRIAAPRRPPCPRHARTLASADKPSSSIIFISHTPALSSSPSLSILPALEVSATALLAVALRGAPAELSLLLCSDADIAALNSRWRAIDVPTDVLSFPQGDGPVLGDVVISLDTAARQADERHCALLDEVRVLLVHGLLHLLGYDHETSSEDLEEMATAERKLMDGLGWDGVGLITASGSSMHGNGASEESGGDI